MTASPRDYLHLHFLVVIWGFTAILGLLIQIPAVEMVFYRTLLAASGLALVLRIRRLRFGIGRRHILQIIATGFLIAGHWILFFGSARVSTASVCLAGMATTSFWTSFLEPWMTGRRVRWYEVMLGLVVMAGLYLIFHFEFGHALGLLMALGSALLAALFTVINSKLTRHHHPFTITFYEMVGATAIIALFFPIYRLTLAEGGRIRLEITAMDLLYLSLLAFVCTVYAYSASVHLMKRISAFAMNLTVNLEPVYGILLAVLIFGDREKMQPGFYLGASVILISVLAHPFLSHRYHKKQMEPDTLR
jgi:drug/metabolite transporter (DMT)-like permease